MHTERDAQIETFVPPAAGYHKQVQPTPKLKRPLLLVLFAAVFLAMPFVNYVAKAFVRGFALSEVDKIAGAFGLSGQLLLAGSLVVGVGLLTTSKWGWWLFVVYAPLFAAYDIYLLVQNPVPYNIGAVAQTALAFAAMAYFLRQDICAPYLASEPRGFRLKKRHSLEIPVQVDGVERATRDLSEGGCAIVWPGCNLELGQKLRITFNQDSYNLELTGVVRRAAADSAGVEFEATPETRASLKSFLAAKRAAK